MANMYSAALKSSYSQLLQFSMKISNSISLKSIRPLYCKALLGIETFEFQRERVKNQMSSISSKFKEKMQNFTNEEDTKNMIFTEDLKNMVHIAESEQDIELVIKMMKKFNQQNKQLRFGNYIFGPVVMRMFYIQNKPDLALECFKSEELNGFFDQLITYQILLDLLFENKMYNDILETFEIIKSRQIEGAKYPKNVIVLVMAACYKMNSKDSLEFALKLWNELHETGHYPMRRATTFCAGLALSQGKPEVAMEVIGAVKNPNYTTVRNIKVACLVGLGRVEDTIPILKSVLSEDIYADKTVHTFNKDVLNLVKEAVAKLENPDIALEFNRIEKLFEKQGHISNLTLDEQLCSEILKPPVVNNNRQVNKFSRYNQDTRNQSRTNKYTSYRKRPSLGELL